MNGQFKIKETNYYGYLDPDSCSRRFRPWIRFLNEQCLVSTAITAYADIQVQPLYDFYSTAVNSTTLDNYKIIGEIRGGKRITITTDDVNRILGFPRNNFAEVPSNHELTHFFQTIHYQGEIQLSKMSKGNLRAEWDLYFDTFAKVFAPTDRRNFGNISSFLQVFGFCCAHNRPINFGEILMKVIINKLGRVMNRNVQKECQS